MRIVNKRGVIRGFEYNETSQYFNSECTRSIIILDPPRETLLGPEIPWPGNLRSGIYRLSRGIDIQMNRS